MMHLNHDRRSFTLVQLLVVIGIIVILVGILVPAVRKARIASQKTACQVQLANIGLALQMYRKDNDDWFPPARALPTLDSGPLSKPTVGEFLRPYVGGQMEVFRCPADDAEDGYFKLYGFSYAYYWELGEKRVHETSLAKAVKTRNIPVLSDGERYHGGKVPWNHLYTDGHVADYYSGTVKHLIGPQAFWK